VSLLVALPVLDDRLASRTVASMSDYVAACTEIVDNSARGIRQYLVSRPGVSVWTPGSPRNLGVAASWNLVGARVVRDELDWLVLLSEAVEFGDPGGEDLVTFLDTCEHAPVEQTPAVGTLLGWKLIALRRETLERVGRFDENLWPAYFEDTDYLYRMALAGLPSPRENGIALPVQAVDARSIGDAHAIRSGLVEVDMPRLAAYYEEKWGGKQGSERFVRPFDHPSTDWRWWPRRDLQDDPLSWDFVTRTA